MLHRIKGPVACLFAPFLLLFAALPVSAQNPTASYLFNNTLNAEQSGIPALIPTDPLAQNGFSTDTVYGQSRRVYHFNGNGLPNTEQAGLSFNATGLVTANNYSVEIVMQLTQNDGAWRRILDVQNRTSDNGFYIDPGNDLDLYPNSGSITTFTENVYHHVVLTNAPSGTVKAYLDGRLEFTADDMQMNLDNANNPGQLINFFLDNLDGGGQGEYSSGKVALIRIYGGVLSDDEVFTLSQSPFQPGTGSSIIIALDPRSTYLHTNGDPGALDTAALNLSLLHIVPGDRLHLQVLREFQFTTNPNDFSANLIGVFSNSNTLLTADQRARVPGAITAGTSYVTPPTSIGTQPTDIAQDFLITDITLAVPTGAQYLFLAASDNFYGDNSNPHNFAGEITVLRTVSGKVTLEGTTKPAQTVQMIFRPIGGGANIVRSVLLLSNGSFSLTDIPRNNYSLWIKGSKWLAQALPADLTTNNLTNVAASLLVGDANNDNTIDLGDFSQLVNSYGGTVSDPGSNYDVAADFNDNGAVDIGDFALLVNNYGFSGDL